MVVTSPAPLASQTEPSSAPPTKFTEVNSAKGKIESGSTSFPTTSLPRASLNTPDSPRVHGALPPRPPPVRAPSLHHLHQPPMPTPPASSAQRRYASAGSTPQMSYQQPAYPTHYNEFPQRPHSGLMYVNSDGQGVWQSLQNRHPLSGPVTPAQVHSLPMAPPIHH